MTDKTEKKQQITMAYCHTLYHAYHRCKTNYHPDACEHEKLLYKMCPNAVIYEQQTRTNELLEQILNKNR